MKKYKFKEYKKNYTELFEKEKKKLKNILPNANIEHIGSTAVEALGGKGVIDILISVPKKDIQIVKDKLINAKYILSKTGGSKYRIAFHKESGLLIRRRVHLALTHINSKIYRDAIRFRNTLRKDSKLRDKYSEIKQKAITLGKRNKDYRDFKEKFIKEVLKR